MIKRFDATLEVKVGNPTSALEIAQYELSLYFMQHIHLDEAFTLIDYNIRLLGEDRYEVYLSYKVVEG